MKLKTGIVGMPNVGKSTLFNAVTEAQGAMCANYPFATIEPNIGVVEVPDPRLVVLQQSRQYTICRNTVTAQYPYQQYKMGCIAQYTKSSLEILECSMPDTPQSFLLGLFSP